MKVGKERIRCIWWNHGDLVERVSVGTRLDIVGKIKTNEFRGHRSAEIDIVDVCLAT
jgi:hypothetical protein